MRMNQLTKSLGFVFNVAIGMALIHAGVSAKAIESRGPLNGRFLNSNNHKLVITTDISCSVIRIQDLDGEQTWVLLNGQDSSFPPGKARRSLESVGVHVEDFYLRSYWQDCGEKGIHVEVSMTGNGERLTQEETNAVPFFDLGILKDMPIVNYFVLGHILPLENGNLQVSLNEVKIQRLGEAMPPPIIRLVPKPAASDIWSFVTTM